MPISQYITTGPLDSFLEDRHPGAETKLELSIEQGRQFYYLIGQFHFNEFSIKRYYAFIKGRSPLREFKNYTRANLTLETDLAYLMEKYPELQIEGKEKRFGRRCHATN